MAGKKKLLDSVVVRLWPSHVCTCLYMFVLYMFVHLIVVVLACHVCTSLSLA